MKRVVQVIVLTGMVLGMAALAGAQGASSIQEPARGSVIRDRRHFPVVTSITGFDRSRADGYSYWISLAAGHDELNAQFPKVYVPTSQYTAYVSDGGTNPFPSAQPMTVLLLKVDAARNVQFTRWLEEGRRTGTYQGLQVLEREIVARMPIYFPSVLLGPGGSTARVPSAPPRPAQRSPATKESVAREGQTVNDQPTPLPTPNAPGTRPGESRLTVGLAAPADRAVPYRPCLSGFVSATPAHVNVLVRGPGTGWYVQPEVVLERGPSGASFITMPYIAESGAQFEGWPFQMVAIVNSRQPLHEGDIVGVLPDAAAQSAVVDLVRDDSAPSGCSLLMLMMRSAVGRILHAWVSAAVHNAAHPLLVFIGVVTFFSLVILRPRAEAADRLLRDWLAASLGVAKHTFAWCRDSIVSLFVSIVLWCRTRAATVWTSRGCSLTAKSYVIRVLLSGAFAPLLWFACVAEIRTAILGLSLIFPAAETPAFEASTLFADRIPNALSGTQTAPAGLLSSLFFPFISVWHEPLGPLAIGLTAVQAIFGTVVLWEVSQREGVRTTLGSLYRERPMPTVCFILLASSLALLAGYRGYELSPSEVAGWFPALAAFLIGLVMPIILAYAVHYLVESLSDSTAILVGGAGVSVVYLSGLSVMTAWSALATGAVAVATAQLVATWLVRVGFGSCLWLAQLFGELLEMVARTVAEWRANSKYRREARWKPATTGTAIITLMLLGMLLWAHSSAAQTLVAKQAVARHDPSSPYTAWALALDVSRSVDRQEFRRMQQVLTRIVERDVAANDLVWLVTICDHSRTTTLFEMPRVPRARRSTRDHIGDDFVLAKAELVAAISGLAQQADVTNMRESLDTALQLLTTQRQATRRNLVVVSDFIQDTRRGVSAVPVDAPKQGAAARVHVALVLTQPTQEYLDHLKISGPELFTIVQSRWTAHFDAMGAATVMAQRLDAIPSK